MKKFITPALRLLPEDSTSECGFRNDPDWWFCPEVLRDYWEIPRDVTCWLEVRSKLMRGSYAINLWMHGEHLYARPLIGRELLSFQYSDALISAAIGLGVTVEPKRFYVRLWTQKQ